jgi:hypothetical protein
MRRQAELLRENDAALASLESAAILRQLVEGEAGTNPATSLE